MDAEATPLPGGAPNPFPGLRPFESDETHLFFGRDGQSDELVKRLGRSRFLAIVGTSGSGKSSLARAGLLPCLHGGFLAGAGSHWRMVTMRPGDDPIGNLARGLAATDLLEDERADPAMQVAIIETVLRRSALGLVEATRQARLGDRENLLILVDQFEELMRFKQVSKSDDAAFFVSLLLEAIGQTALPIFIVLTMRSDFLGECSQFRDLPEALNDSQFLIPRMTRDQRRNAIVGPVAVGRAAIAPRLVQRLLNDVGDNPDQLPILQHALMRTWDYWKEHRATPREPLDLAHYEAIGGMAEALSRHVDVVYGELTSDRQRDIAERLFKCLTERGRDNREIRRPTTVGEICGVAEAEPPEVIAVADLFRREGRSFLMPPPGITLTVESVIDISHESLIRQWSRLRTWVEEETECAEIYARLVDAADLLRTGQAGLWRDPQLQIALDWRQKYQRNRAWGLRYDARFDAGMAFLDRSLEERDAEAALKAREREAKRRRAYALAAASTVIAMLLATLAAYAVRNSSVAEAALKKADEARQLADANQKKAEENAAAAITATRAATLSKEDAEKARLEEQGARAVALARNPGREIDALVLALQSAGPKREAGLPPAAVSSLAAAVTAARRSFPLRGHGGPVAAAAFSPDGSRLLTSTSDSEMAVRLWDRADGRLLATIPQTRNGISNNAVKPDAFSPDGSQIIVAANDATAHILDARTGALIRRIQPVSPAGGARPQSVSAAAFSPVSNSVVVVAGFTNGIAFWNPKTGEMLAPIDLQGWTYTTFSADGSRLLTGGQINQVQVWTAPGGARLQRWQLGRTVAGAFSPDGSRALTEATNGAAALIDTNTGERIATPFRFVYSISPSTFSSNSAFVVAPDGLKTLMVEASTGKLREELTGTSRVTSAAFSKDDTTIVSTHYDGSARVWRGTLAETLQGHQLAVVYATFSRDGRYLVTTSVDRTARLWDLRDDRSRRTLPAGLDQLESAAFALNGQRALLATPKVAELWDPLSGKRLGRIEAGAGEMATIIVSPDGRRILTVDKSEAKARLWDADTLRPVAELRGTRDAPLESAAFVPGGNLILTGGATWMAWDSITGRRVRELRGSSSRDLSAPCTFSADGSRAIASAGKDEIVLLDTRTGREISTHKFQQNIARSCLMPDGVRVVIKPEEDPTRLDLWDARTWRPLGRLQGHRAEIRTIEFSPDGKLMTTASDDQTAGVWNADTGQRIFTLEGHTAGVEDAVFSADGARILTRGPDRSARVWDVATGYQLAILQGHADEVTSAAFSADGNSVLTASRDGTAKIYDVRLPVLVEEYFTAACGLLRYQPEFEQVRKYCEAPRNPTKR